MARDPNTRWLKALVFISIVGVLLQMGQTMTSQVRQSKAEIAQAKFEVALGKIETSIELLRHAKIGQDDLNAILVAQIADHEARIKALENGRTKHR